MSMKSKWQEEFDALPEWAQHMVRAAAHAAAYGDTTSSNMLKILRDGGADHTVFEIALPRDARDEWWDGWFGMKELADAMTAPWPPPEPPKRERRAFNVVEFMSGDGDGGGFVEPCCFGSLVPGHSVYCHNTAWPNSPRKCHRNRTDRLHEECPGFVPNPDLNRT